MNVNKTYYPAWVCHECGQKYGNRSHAGEASTWHYDVCGICGLYVPVTEPRDFLHLKKGWEKAVMTDKNIDFAKLHDALNDMYLEDVDTIVVLGTKIDVDDNGSEVKSYINIDGDYTNALIAMAMALHSLDIDKETFLRVYGIVEKMLSEDDK